MTKKIVTAEDRCEKLASEFLELFKKTTSMIEAISPLLEKVILTNESVNDALLNVLVAIRQNEYLQAYYPEQKGIPAMKIVGNHPASAISTKLKEAKNARR